MSEVYNSHLYSIKRLAPRRNRGKIILILWGFFRKFCVSRARYGGQKNHPVYRPSNTHEEHCVASASTWARWRRGETVMPVLRIIDDWSQENSVSNRPPERYPQKSRTGYRNHRGFSCKWPFLILLFSISINTSISSPQTRLCSVIWWSIRGFHPYVGGFLSHKNVSSLIAWIDYVTNKTSVNTFHVWKEGVRIWKQKRKYGSLYPWLRLISILQPKRLTSARMKIQTFHSSMLKLMIQNQLKSDWRNFSYRSIFTAKVLPGLAYLQ